jgi:DNA-binding transcriptional regulator YiaG
VKRDSFAKQLARERESLGYTQAEAAKAWDVSVRTLQKWETGERAPTRFVAKCILFWISMRRELFKK